MNTDAKRYYAMLGLEPACSDEDIRSAFRRRAKELHPDLGAENTTGFIRLKKAYDTLIDPALRAQYDRASSTRIRRTMRAAFNPPPPRARPARSGGMSFARYFTAFLLMGGVSFGAIEWMISESDAPMPTPRTLITLRAPAQETASRRETETAKGDELPADRARPASAWDARNPNGTPREDEGERPRRRPNSGFGASPTE